MTENPVAIVTGASSGIGARTALAFAGRGYAVVLAARRADRLRAVAEQCRQAGAEALPKPSDVADEAQVRALVDAAVEQFGRVDVLVNNAGYGHFGRVHEITDADMRAIFDVNFFGVFYGCKAVAPVMIGQRSGHIFNVSSVIGKRGSPFHGAYSASKFAVCGLGESLRVELASHNVRVTNVCPALTATEFFGQVTGRRQARGRSEYLRRAHKMPADRVARKIVACVGKNRPEMIFTAAGRFLILLNTLWPRAADRIMKVYHDDLARAAELAEPSE